MVPTGGSGVGAWTGLTVRMVDGGLQPGQLQERVDHHRLHGQPVTAPHRRGGGAVGRTAPPPSPPPHALVKTRTLPLLLSASASRCSSARPGRSGAGTGSGAAPAATTTLVEPGTPALSETNGTVTLSWTAATAPGAGTVDYFVQRRDEFGTTWADACGTTATVRITALTCDDVPGAGAWVLAGHRVLLLVDGHERRERRPRGRQSRPHAADRLDHRAVGRSAIVRGSITVSSDSADVESGVANARFQRSPHGVNTWTTIDVARHDRAVRGDVGHDRGRRRPLRPARDHDRQRRQLVHVADRQQTCASTTPRPRSRSPSSGPTGATKTGSTVYFKLRRRGQLRLRRHRHRRGLRRRVRRPSRRSPRRAGRRTPRETVSTPAGGPYSSSDVLVERPARATPASYTITATDVAGNTSTATITFSRRHDRADRRGHRTDRGVRVRARDGQRDRERHRRGRRRRQRAVPDLARGHQHVDQPRRRRHDVAVLRDLGDHRVHRRPLRRARRQHRQRRQLGRVGGDHQRAGRQHRAHGVARPRERRDGAYKPGDVVFFKANAAGSFGLVATVTDGGSRCGSRPRSRSSAPPTGRPTSAQTVSTPAGGRSRPAPSAGSPPARRPGTYGVTGTDAAGNTVTSAITFTVDSTAPTGSVTAPAAVGERAGQRGERHVELGRCGQWRRERAVPDLARGGEHVEQPRRRRHDVAVRHDVGHDDRLPRRPLRPARHHDRQRRQHVHQRDDRERAGRQHRADGLGHRASARPTRSSRAPTFVDVRTSSSPPP